MCDIVKTRIVRKLLYTLVLRACRPARHVALRRGCSQFGPSSATFLLFLVNTAKCGGALAGNGVCPSLSSGVAQCLDFINPQDLFLSDLFFCNIQLTKF